MFVKLLKKGLTRWVVLSLCIWPLISCATTQATVPSMLLTCKGRPEIVGKKGERLSDADIAELMLRLDERGENCAQRLERVRKLLKSHGEVVG